MGLRRRGPLPFSLCRRPDDLLRRENPDVAKQALKGGTGSRDRREEVFKSWTGEEDTMEEEEEEALGYLDKVLEEEEEVFEYGDGELDPITPVHKQFKVRQAPDSKTQEKKTKATLKAEGCNWSPLMMRRQYVALCACEPSGVCAVVCVCVCV